MKKIMIFALLVVLLPLLGGAQVKIEKPRSKQATSFAIVTDAVTYKNTKEAMTAYRNALEADGLSTYVISSMWKNPDQVRAELQKLYERTPNLEGVVFIGDIPVVLVRNAQHMTSAFKMDEDGFPMNESSVASDRFYDDLNLQFDFIKQDSINPLHFYYNLRTDSPQHLNLTFYSGRIMYPTERGGDKYAEIAKYLTKVVRERKQNDQLDHIVTFAGDAYNSDCLVAWMDEKIAINENFPLTNKNNLTARHLNFRMDQAMKFPLFSELSRPEVDVMLFNEHGSPDKQHINGNMPLVDFKSRYEAVKSEIYYNIKREARKKDGDVPGAKEYFKKEYNLTDEFFVDFNSPERKRKDSLDSDHIIISLPDLKEHVTNPRFVMFNACYNGSFHKAGNIASYYIFNDGRNVVTQGNTVNVLQDRWTYELIGLLSHGVRVGQYNRQIATLEGHIIGDPAFRFKPIFENTLSSDIVTRKADTAYWESLLNADFADIQSLALRMLVLNDSDRKLSPMLLQKMKDSNFATTRMECLKLLSRYHNDDFLEGIRLGLRDAYELTRRNAANYAGEVGDSRLLNDVVDAYLNDSESHRMNYTLFTSFQLFDQAALISACEKAFTESLYLDREALSKHIAKVLKNAEKRATSDFNQIFDTAKSKADRLQGVRSVRNNPYHAKVSDYLKFVADDTQDMYLRINMAEALGWFGYSYRCGEIISALENLLQDPTVSSELKSELQQSLIRLQ